MRGSPLFWAASRGFWGSPAILGGLGGSWWFQGGKTAREEKRSSSLQHQPSAHHPPPPKKRPPSLSPFNASFCKAAWQRRYDEVIKSLLWSWRRKKNTESSQVSFQGLRNLKTCRGNLLAASRVCQQPPAIFFAKNSSN